MMAPVAAELFIAQAALPVLLLLHGPVLPMQVFQGLATTRTCYSNTAKYSRCAQRLLHMQSMLWDASAYFTTLAHGHMLNLVLSYVHQADAHTHTHNSNSSQPNKNCITCCVRCCALSNADTLGWSCSSTLRGESLSRSKSLWLTHLSLATPLLFWSASSAFSPLLWACMRFSERTCFEYTRVHFLACAPSSRLSPQHSLTPWHDSSSAVQWAQLIPPLSFPLSVKSPPLFVCERNSMSWPSPIRICHGVWCLWEYSSFFVCELQLQYRPSGSLSSAQKKKKPLSTAISQVELWGSRRWTPAITSLRAAEENSGCQCREAERHSLPFRELTS